MSTLYRTACHVDMKTTPAWYEQKRPRTGTSRSHSPDRTGAVGQRGFGARENLLLLVLFVISFSISKSCIFCRGLFQWLKAIKLIIQSSEFWKALEIVKIQRNALCKSKARHLCTKFQSSFLNIYLHFSGFQSYSFTSATVRVAVHTITMSGTGTYPIGDDSLSRSTRRSFAPLQKPPQNQHFTCEQNSYPIWLSWRPKSYPL